ncbi:peptidoglycan DD-metalloendopeptidase family protein [Buchnera aphidicola (Aphis fabae)]|uniref:Peptidoglycan DD-metalloendopeptidase family protein n=1 Tax=Buchnera aphidicola (Aphis fabae) TaxID=571430 RepID=A0A5J6ZAS4_9GAMM|nr:peptidoglycan DD-metalloendopeptidase family protein [Buchnera aphidicola]QFQ32492.1 peptidoglycan DD-metalloendopeptidase family protein [Buchnera aphidicola (Aphis fabae)]
MSIFFIKTIIISLILSSCSILTEGKKISFNQFDFIKTNNQLSNNTKENNKEKNKNVNTQIFKNYKKIQNESDFLPYSSKNIFIKKIIYIKKNSNFFKSAYESGLNLSDINTIIKAIEWQINFRKLNINSTFNLIFLKKQINSKKNKNILLGIKVNNLGKTYYAIRATNGNFYNINGINKSKMIMDFSFLKKYRISSHFNLHRLHPITHHISRHLGVDLAMPEGTLVLSTSNGEITKTAFSKTSGFYIVLNNKNQYTTKYMHLKKILVTVGQKIKINQKIALSGNTGRTTGPHLHYEIWINKHAINPIYAQASFIEPLTQKELISYFKTSQIILSKLK